MDISKAFRVARKTAKVTQGFVADKAGLTTSAYAHFEQGVKTPSVATIRKVAAVYALPAELLLALGAEEKDVAKGKITAYKKLYPVIGQMIVDMIKIVKK